MHIDNIDDQETQTLLDSLAAFNVTQHVRENSNTQQRPYPGHNNHHNRR